MEFRVAIVQGSESDNQLGDISADILKSYNIECDRYVISAHRNPEELAKFCESANEKYGVIIAIAGLSAALPGVIASRTRIPVIGVPVDAGPLNGVDALLSIVQMPSGVPVACMGIGKSGAKNAAHLTARILGISSDK
ncbi:5-(carboxyamino)imidazole ribonucleotide mutase [bacterium]|nr:MAG: 5-(carboxyamino)imidazole ribonucleotide mutase [bacterium]